MLVLLRHASMLVLLRHASMLVLLRHASMLAAGGRSREPHASSQCRPRLRVPSLWQLGNWQAKPRPLRGLPAE
jgi:hypothetical protein